jgi:hypothetical protein
MTGPQPCRLRIRSVTEGDFSRMCQRYKDEAARRLGKLPGGFRRDPLLHCSSEQLCDSSSLPFFVPTPLK